MFSGAAMQQQLVRKQINKQKASQVKWVPVAVDSLLQLWWSGCMKSLHGFEGQVAGALHCSLLAPQGPVLLCKLSYALKQVLITAESGEERDMSLLREFRKVCSQTRSQGLSSGCFLRHREQQGRGAVGFGKGLLPELNRFTAYLWLSIVHNIHIILIQMRHHNLKFLQFFKALYLFELKQCILLFILIAESAS